MPRAIKSKSEATASEPKRAPRRKVAAGKTRKAVAASDEKMDSAALAAEALGSPVKRKAPMRLDDSKGEDTMVGAVKLDSSSKRSLYVSGTLLALALIVAVTVGYSDSGQINTAAVITERNTKVAAGETVVGSEGGGSQAVPVQNTATVPNGGLVSSGISQEPTPAVPAAEVATSTASTTEEVASSSESIVSDTEEANREATEGEENPAPEEPTLEAEPLEVSAE